jgi:tetratricopeptide (TPR) repeat protein
MSFLDRRIGFALLACACYGQSTGYSQSMDSVHMFDTDIPDKSLAARPGVNSDSVFAPNRLPPGPFAVPPMIDASNQQIQPEEFNAAPSLPAGITGTVSAQSLAKPPSKNALKYLTKAEHYSQAGNSAKAIEILRSAPMDPAGAPYLHSRLGTEYLKAGQFALAAPELEEAARLLPREPIHHSNLAYVYKVLGQYERAEKEARLALTLDDSSAKAHFLLGSILIEHKSGLEEAVTNLKFARAEVPSARFLLAQVYLYTGHRDAAAREMQDYLSVATEAQRFAAEQWLTQHSRRP